MYCVHDNVVAQKHWPSWGDSFGIRLIPLTKATGVLWCFLCYYLEQAVTQTVHFPGNFDALLMWRNDHKLFFQFYVIYVCVGGYISRFCWRVWSIYPNISRLRCIRCPNTSKINKRLWVSRKKTHALHRSENWFHNSGDISKPITIR